MIDIAIYFTHKQIYTFFKKQRIHCHRNFQTFERKNDVSPRTNKSFFLSTKKWLHFFHKRNDWIFLRKKKTFEISSARKPLNLLAKKRLNFFCQAKRLHFSLTKLTKCFYCKKRFFFLLNTKWLNFSLPNKKPLIFFLPK